MEQLPIEKLYDVAMPMSYENIKNLCRTNKNFSAICKDDYFWYTKIKQSGLLDGNDEHYKQHLANTGITGEELYLTLESKNIMDLIHEFVKYDLTIDMIIKYIFTLNLPYETLYGYMAYLGKQAAILQKPIIKVLSITYPEYADAMLIGAADIYYSQGDYNTVFNMIQDSSNLDLTLHVLKKAFSVGQFDIVKKLFAKRPSLLKDYIKVALAETDYTNNSDIIDMRLIQVGLYDARHIIDILAEIVDEQMVNVILDDGEINLDDYDPMYIYVMNELNTKYNLNYDLDKYDSYTEEVETSEF